MKQPRHVWFVFALALVVAIVGMAWLSLRVTDLERTNTEGAHQAVFEADVRLALRRMDSFLNQLFVEQSAWPYVAYQPSYTIAASDKDVDVASPLMLPNSPLVKLYFQVAPDRTFTSPGVPTRGARPADKAPQLTAQQVAGNTQLLSQLSRLADPETILAHCAPPRPLTAETIAALAAPPQQSLASSLPSEKPANLPEQQLANNEAAPQFAQSSEQQKRGAWEYATRKSRYQSQADNYNVQAQLRDQYNNPAQRTAAQTSALEGPSRPIWIRDELLLARRVNVSDQTVLQGCWFNWPAIKDALRAEVADLGLLGNVDIIPVHDSSKGDPARMLATLDAQLIASPPSLPMAATSLTPVRWALLAAWIALAVAALAAAVLLRGVMALSERRAAFVSAVTHELRTPLTTFRMYSEMLAEGMVSDETQRRGYLSTLKAEADRLFHLIENVLSYARLERGRPSVARSTASLGEMLGPVIRRLAERAARDEMSLEYTMDEKAAATVICTDAGALEQILVNLVDNACKYAAAATDRRIEVTLRRRSQAMEISVSDHGPGVSAVEAGRLFRPFTKSANQAAQTAPGVGLGLAVSRRLARDLGGALELATAAGSGAVFTLTLPLTRDLQA